MPASRTALAEFFGLDNVRIDIAPGSQDLPTMAPGTIGREVTLAEAEAELGLSAALPDGARPDAVYLVDDQLGAAAMILVYNDDGFELWQRGRFDAWVLVPGLLRYF